MSQLDLYSPRALWLHPVKYRFAISPPDNPENFHTITVSSNALNAHLGHGDLLGQCADYGEQLCDDGDACTIDIFDAVTETCLVEHPPVDCDDSDLCTLDSCSPATGCQYAPIICDDNDACTADFCNAGECLAAEINCGEFALCDTVTGCYDPCGGISCEPIDACHLPGQCIFPGECAIGLPVANDTPCDDGNSETIDDRCVDGMCEGIAACESFEIVNLAPNGTTSTRFNAVWHTDVPSTSQVSYAVTSGGDTHWTSLDTELVTEHIVTVTGLSPFRIYYYIAESENACGYLARSQVAIMRTAR